MKLKLDENLGGTAFRYLVDAGCDVSTVRFKTFAALPIATSSMSALPKRVAW